MASIPSAPENKSDAHIKDDTALSGDFEKLSVCQDVDETTSAFKREDIKLPKDFENKLAFVLYNVFSEKECNEYIKKTEKMGYETALLNIGKGRQEKITDVRKSSRCIWDSVEEAYKIWERIKQHIPAVCWDKQVVGLNERLRFLRYDPGEYFKPHLDGAYRRDNGERSYITVQLYLNEGFKGGSTTFMDHDFKNKIEVVPKTGMVLVFDHGIMHEGSELKKGRKYCVRTDVMYAPKKAQKTGEDTDS